MSVIVYSAHADAALRAEAHSFGAVFLEKDQLLTDLVPSVLTAS
jgi:hypothetical protein